MAENETRLWLSIRRTPEDTISIIVKQKESRSLAWITVLLAIAFAQIAFIQMMLNTSFEYFSWSIVIIAVFVGIIVSLLYIFVFGYLLAFIGAWFEGIAKQREIKYAIAWSSIPALVAILAWVPATIFVLAYYINISGLSLFYIMLISTIFQMGVVILYAYSFGILVRSLAVLHKISRGRAFITVALGSAVFVTPITVFFLLNQ